MINFGMKVITDDSCHSVIRTWKERLFTRPWKPFQKGRMVPNLKLGECLRFGDSIVMNSQTKQQLLAELPEPRQSGGRGEG